MIKRHSLKRQLQKLQVNGAHKRRARSRRARRGLLLLRPGKKDRAYAKKCAEIDCLRDCPSIGSCCRCMVIWSNGRPWPGTEDPIEAQAEIDKRGLPFVLLATGHTTVSNPNRVTDEHAWYITCNAVLPDGLCGIYEHRPTICSSFRPGMDPLCVKHPDHETAKERFDLGMGEYLR